MIIDILVTFFKPIEKKRFTLLVHHIYAQYCDSIAGIDPLSATSL